MSRQYWKELIWWTTGDGTAIANTTTETIIFPNVTLPANYQADGRTIFGLAVFRYSTTATPTLRFRLRWGSVAGTVIADSGTMTTATVTNTMGRVSFEFTTRGNGASGSIFSTGGAKLFGTTAPTVSSATGAPAIAPMGSAGISAPVAVTVDLTADTALSLTAAWSAASASNTLTGHQYYGTSAN